MEGGEPLTPIFPKESALLERALLHRRRYARAQADISTGGESRSIDWVRIQDFTVDVGERQIRDYIETWALPPRWLYCVNVVGASKHEHHTFHHYRAAFSTPTKEKPIETKACVYFVVDVSKVKPHTRPVEVLFMIESNRLVHTPGRTTFREQWLKDVIESKNSLREAVDL